MSRRSRAGRRRPSFFKVLLGDFSIKLRIPLAFYKNFEGNVPQQSRLRTPAGTWFVNVEKVNDRLFFQNGWKKFVQDHSLKLGEFLIFKYAGNSELYVDIYGKNTCKKVFKKAIRKSETPPEEGHGNVVHRTRTKQATSPVKVEVIDIESDTSMHIDEPETEKNQLSEDSESQWPEELSSKEYLSTRAQVANPRTARALEAAEEYSSSSKLPFFSRVLNKTYVNNRYLLVPSWFMKYYIKEKTKGVELRVSKSWWPVKFVHAPNNRTTFSAGWGKFAKDNALKEGDVCVFELIKRVDVVLKVSVFRCSS